MSQPFTYLFRVRYAECDPQGVVFNGRYVEYTDVAFTEFVRTALGGYQELYRRMDVFGDCKEDVAAELGLTIPALKARLHRVRKTLRDEYRGATA